MCYQPVFIARYLKDYTIVSDKIDISAKHCFHISWTDPFGFADYRVPCFQRRFSLSVTLPEMFQRRLGDYLHGLYLSHSQYGNNTYFP
jgi:hypothetical protein